MDMFSKMPRELARELLLPYQPLILSILGIKQEA
jgi:hypothetical protein